MVMIGSMEEYIAQTTNNGEKTDIDVVGYKITSTQIVRCFRCQHLRRKKGGGHICILTGAKVKVEDFCSHGVRRRNDEEENCGSDY